MAGKAKKEETTEEVKELPLIVKPKGGKWANKAQEEYAKIVNAYAYANPDKWHNERVDMNGNPIPKSSKKEVLLKRLTDLEKAPGLLVQFMGNPEGDNKKLSFKNKLHED